MIRTIDCSSPAYRCVDPTIQQEGCQTVAMTKIRRFGGQITDAILLGEANYRRARLRYQ